MQVRRIFTTDRDFDDVKAYVLDHLVSEVRQTSGSLLSRFLKPRILQDENQEFRVSSILEKRLFLRVFVTRTDSGSKIEVQIAYRLGYLIFIGCVSTVATVGLAAFLFVPLLLWARRRFKRYAARTEVLLKKDLQARLA